MGIIKRALLGLFLVSIGTVSAADKPLDEASDFAAFIFGDYDANSGNNNGAIAVGGSLDIKGYSVATKPDGLPEYSILVEGDAKFKNGRLYHGKIRVQGDASGIHQSVINGFPQGTELENFPLDYSIKDLKNKYLAMSSQLAALAANGTTYMQWGGLYFEGDGAAPLQVFNVKAEDLKKAHSVYLSGVPTDATLIINVVEITMKKLQVVNKSLSAFTPYREKTLFNFIDAEIVMFNGISVEGSVLAPTAKVEGKNGNMMGQVIANQWWGQMHFEGLKFKGQWVDDEKPLSVQITEPATLSTVGYSPVSVKGLVTGNVAELTLNGVPVTVDGETFEGDVALVEGFNTITARVTSDAGEQLTDSISVSLDLTPPHLTVDSHEDYQTVYSDKITVTGLVNDIVRGTVEDEQATVEVNGVVAMVSNRSYAAKDVPLVEGENLLTVSALDQAGNITSVTRTIFYKAPEARQVILVSGQDQSGIIAQTLAQSLTVKVVDANSNPVAGESVIFRVVQGAGVVGADTDTYGRAIVTQTDADGLADTTFHLGYRTGVANHKVRAKVVGYENEVIFYASAESVIGNKISINSGNNQRGVVGQNLPAPFIVAVTDAGANVVKGSRVRFETIAGGGVFQNDQAVYETVTDSDGRALAHFKLGTLAGIDMQRIKATLIDAPDGQSLTAGFMATGFVAADPGQTSVVGSVLDNQDKPIPGVTIRVEGTDRTATTDAQGRFKVEQVPVGPVHIIADGSTATVTGEYPSLGYHLVTVAGVENPLSAPIYMVKLDTDNAVYAGPEDVSLTLPRFPGFQLDIAKDSITFPDGSREGLVSVTSVNASKVPMAPPNGMQPQFIVTIQPVGATFDPPAKLTLPNVDGHAPGAQVEMYSFDHDLEEFVSIGLGTVSEDGSVVSSNPGVGVFKAGWHCGSQPGGSGTAHNCPTCYKCENDDCVRDPAQDNTPLDQQTPEDCKTALCKGQRAEPGDKPTEDTIKGDCRAPGCNGMSPDMAFEINDGDVPEDTTKEDCKKPGCSGGNVIEQPDDSDKPTEDPVEGDCKKPGCSNGAVVDEPDDQDIKEEDKECKECSGGNLNNKPDGTKIDGEECKECQGGTRTNKPDGTEIEGDGKECKQCVAGEEANRPDGYKLPDDKCKYCEDGQVKDISDTWKDDASVGATYALPDRVKNFLNDGIKKIPNINVQVEEVNVAVKGKMRDCCNKDTGDITENGQKEIEASGTLVFKLKDFKIWPAPGAPNIAIEKSFVVFGEIIEISAALDAGVFFSSNIQIGAKWGKRSSECRPEDNCQFAALGASVGATVAATAFATACADSTFFNNQYCTPVIEFTPAALSAEVEAQVGYNVENCSSGWDATMDVKGLVFKVSLSFPGLPSFEFGYDILKKQVI